MTTGEPMLKCDFCGRKFKTLRGLVNHPCPGKKANRPGRGKKANRILDQVENLTNPTY